MVACGWVQHDHHLMWRQSDVLSGRPIDPRVLALDQSRLLTAMCWDCVRVAGGQPWLSWRAGSAFIAGIGTGLGDTSYCRPKFCAVFLCSLPQPSGPRYWGLGVRLGNSQGWKPQKVGGCGWSRWPRNRILSHVAKDMAYSWFVAVGIWSFRGPFWAVSGTYHGVRGPQRAR